jgi:hypothetical protein
LSGLFESSVEGSPSGAECDAGANLAHRLVDQGKTAFAVATFVGLGPCQFGARVLQQSERRIHMRLLAESVSNSHARRDQNSEQNLMAGSKLRHCPLQIFKKSVIAPPLFTAFDSRQTTPVADI